jgi:hypothetical protein
MDNLAQKFPEISTPRAAFGANQFLTNHQTNASSLKVLILVLFFGIGCANMAFIYTKHNNCAVKCVNFLLLYSHSSSLLAPLFTPIFSGRIFLAFAEDKRQILQ